MLVYFALWGIALTLATTMFPAAILLAVVIGVCNVRVFNIQHDCTHRSYFSNGTANDVAGTLLGIVTLTPHFYWSKSHLRHHGMSGNLDHADDGYIVIYTVAEFEKLPRHRKIFYVLYRNPVVYLLLGPIYQYIVMLRIPYIAARGTKARLSIHFENAVLVAIYLVVYFAYPEPMKFLVIHLIGTMVAGTIGLWLFYVQHNFEGAYWRRSDEWTFVDAALRGSSHLRLPGWLEWFFAHINLHHVHHLHPKVPNYHLKDQIEHLPAGMDQASDVRIWDSFAAFGLKLWDEDAGKLVGFRASAGKR